MKTKPLTPWKPRDPFSASHLQESVDQLRAHNITVGGGGIRTLSNGSIVDIPIPFDDGDGIFGVVTDSGPAGETDFTNEQYWIRLTYCIADKWGIVVDIEKDYPASGSDLSYVIVPATNMCERQPGGPSGTGGHGLPIGFPVLLIPIMGRATSSTDTTVAQRFLFFSGGIPVKAQYDGQVEQAIAEGIIGATYMRGYMLNPSGTSGT